MSQKKKFRAHMRALGMEIREHKRSFAIYTILRLLVLGTMISQIFQHNWENVFLCILTLLLFLVPSFVQMEFKIELPTTLEIIILCFIFAAEILGEIHRFYMIIPYWDTILHTLNGFLAAAIGFSLVNLLNHNPRMDFQLSPAFVCLVAFCFSMTIGVLWEFAEYGLDTYFGNDCQKDTIVTEIRSVALNPEGLNVPVVISDIHEVTVNGEVLPIDGYLDIGLIDTMDDLFVNFIGAVCFSVAGYFYLAFDKHRSQNFVKNFVPVAKNEENDFLAQSLEAQQDMA